MKYGKGKHPNSLKNLGKPKTKEGMRRFRFTPSVNKWLEEIRDRGENMTTYVENLIIQDMKQNK